MTLTKLVASTKPHVLPDHPAFVDILVNWQGGWWHGQADAERAVRADLRDTDKRELEEQHWKN